MVKIFDIKWDVDEEKDLEFLPKEVYVQIDMDDDEDEDYISDWISDMFGFCHDGFCVERTKKSIWSEVRNGDRVYISGDSSNLWIKDYNVQVDSMATVEEAFSKMSKKMLLTIDTIDGDQNVCCSVRKSGVLRIERY